MNALILQKINIGYGILLIFAVISLLQGFNNAVLRTNGSQDFQWGPSQALLYQRNPYTPFLDYQEGISEENPYILSQAPNYPASAYIFLWPYSAFDWIHAKLLWAVSNILFTVLILFSLQKIWPLKNLAFVFIVAALFVMSTPHRNLVGNGQHALFCLAFFLLSIVFSRKNKFLSGLFLAISWFKYTITFPLSLFFLTKKNHKILLISATIHLLLTGFISFWINESPTEFFFKPIEVAMGLMGRGDMDLFGLSSRLGLPTIIPIIVSLILLIAAIVISYRNQQDVKDSIVYISFLALISYALFFHLRYDLVILIFPLWFVFYYGMKDILGYLYAVLIIITWYLQRVIFFMDARFESQIITNIDNVLYIFVVFAFYTVLLLTFKRILSAQQSVALDA